jgi:hypothetical protein
VTIYTGKVTKLVSDPQGFVLTSANPSPPPATIDIAFEATDRQQRVASAAYLKGSDCDVDASGTPIVVASVTAK